MFLLSQCRVFQWSLLGSRSTLSLTVIVSFRKSKINVVFRSISMVFDDSRISGNDRFTGHIKIDKRIRRNKNIVTDYNLTHQDSSGSNKNLVADLGKTLSRASIFLADRHYMRKSAIIPKFYHTINDNRPAMANIKSFPDPGIG